jgi:copper(I)-binding protein
VPAPSGAASAVLAALLLVSCKASSPSPAITIDSARARATAPGQSATAAYFTITNTGGGDRLVGISSRTGRASLHSTSIDGGVMRMRQLDALDIPAKSTIALEPGAIHVMITGLRQPLAAGQQLPLELTFKRSGRRVIIATVGAGDLQ